MAGGTQVTTTSTEPWEAQKGFLEEGMRLGQNLYRSGQFDPEFYGAPGTVGEGLPSGQVAPGVAGFDPDQAAAMKRSYDYAMGPIPEA